MKTKIQHKGQVALVLVLIMTIVSALAVSLASRSTVDTRIQQTETNSVQALLLAQTGVEQMLMNPSNTSITTASYSANLVNTGTDKFATGRIDPGSTVELNLSGADYSTLTGFSVYWKADVGSPGGQPAIYISLISSTGVITDYAFDYLGNNGFTAAGDGSGLGFEKKTPKINLSATISKVRISVLGSPALMEIVPLDSGAIFPSQQKSIQSVGNVQLAGSNVKYGLQYDESTSDTIPAVFDYALFSGGSIIQ